MLTVGKPRRPPKPRRLELIPNRSPDPDSLRIPHRFGRGRFVDPKQFRQAEALRRRARGT